MAVKNPPYNEEKNGESLVKNLVGMMADIMKVQGISMNQLAKKSGVSVATVSRILSYETQPKFGTLIELLKVLGVHMEITLNYMEEAK